MQATVPAPSPTTNSNLSPTRRQGLDLSPTRKRGRQRRGIYFLKLLVLIGILGGAGWGVRWWYFGNNAKRTEITATATRGNLVITVSERGELESAKTLDVRCEVEGREHKIVWIIPDGTRVAKGDKVLTFDTDQLLKTKADQEVKVALAEGKAKGCEGDLKAAENKAEDEIEKAKLALKLAILDRDKYIDEQGEYTAEVQDKKGALALAKKELEETKNKLEQFRKSVKKGLFPTEQLRAKEAEFAQKEFNVKRDEAKLVVLEKFTRQRQVEELTAKAADAQRALERASSSGEAAVAKAKSELQAANIALKLEKTILERIQKQIDSCTVKSPGDGILVYWKERWWNENNRIQAGALVYYHQTLFSLPDLTQMQMKVGVHEAMVKKVQVEQAVEIRLDALPGKVMKGKVKSIGTLARSDGYSDRFVKQFDTIVTIEDLPVGAGLKPGFMGDAKILVNELAEVLMVPVQAVGQRDGKHYCYVAGEKGIADREVTVGENNDRFVEIKEGLEEGEKVTLDARARIAAETKGREPKPEAPAEKPRPPAGQSGTAPG